MTINLEQSVSYDARNSWYRLNGRPRVGVVGF